MKTFISKLLLRFLLPRFDRDLSPFTRVLGQAVRCQLGKIPEGEFREALANFYEAATPSQLMEDICFEPPCATAYKTPVIAQKEDRRAGKWSFWRRRFGLLRHLGIRCDVLHLMAGQQVAPHGHFRVVSGFYVLEGAVAIRHYNRLAIEGRQALIRKVVDTTLSPGGYTTNSEHYHNVHWLLGIAPVSHLFRLTVAGTPDSTGGNVLFDERMYLDPTGEERADGTIAATIVTAAEAEKVSFGQPTGGDLSRDGRS